MENCLPFSPTLRLMPKMQLFCVASLETGRVTEKQVAAVTNLITHQFIFGLSSFQPGFLSPLTLIPLQTAALIKHQPVL